MDNNVINLFPKKPFTISAEVVSKEFLLEYWKERNQILSDTFHTLSVYQKQETLDVILKINDELYELALDLKAKLKLMGEMV